MSAGKFQLFSLVSFNVAAFDCFNDFIGLGFCPSFYQFADSFFINGIGGVFQQIRHDFGCRLAKRVRKHTGNTDIGNSHAVLDAVFLGRFHADQLETVSGNFPKLAKIFRRDKGASYEVKLVKVGNPFRVLFVRFLAFDGFDIFGMCKAHINVIF